MAPMNALGDTGKVLHRRQYLQGVTIFEQGEVAHEAYLIEKGRVEITVKSENGQSEIIAILGSGDIFGEMALMKSPHKRVATAKALEKTELVLISYEQLSEKLSQCDPLIRALFYMFIKRLDRLFNPADIS